MFRTVSPETLAAIHAQDAPVPFMELIDSGLLWWINKEAFHRLGRKLQVTPEGFRLLGNGLQGRIVHDDLTDTVRFPSFTRTAAIVEGQGELDWFYKFLE